MLFRRWDVGQGNGDHLCGVYLFSYPRFLLRLVAPSVPISSLLNTSTSDRSSDAETLHQIRLIAGLLTWTSPIRAPPHINDCLSQIVDYFGLAPSAPPSSAELSNILRAPNSTSTLSSLNAPPTLRHDVRLNRQTTLSTLYTFENIDAYVEYPETNADRPVGYLFRCDPNNWNNPAHNFTYSLGKPSGQTKKGAKVECSLLVGQGGETVPCIQSHYTCM